MLIVAVTASNITVNDMAMKYQVKVSGIDCVICDDFVKIGTSIDFASKSHCVQ